MVNSKSILGYVSGDCDSREIEDVAHWAALSKSNRNEIIRARKMYMSSLLNYPLPSDREVKKTTAARRRRSVFGFAVGAAAAIALAVFGIFRYSASETEPAQLYAQSFFVPSGQRAMITLSDNTSVWLNSNSSICFECSEGKRVALLTGDALFDVAKDPQHPFVVRAGSREITVLGTKFEVSAYSDTTFSLNLYEGLVEFRDKETRQYAQVHPNQRIELDENGVYHLKNVALQGTSRWAEGYYCFDDASYCEILKTIGEYLGIEFCFENPRVADFKCSCTFKAGDDIFHFLSVLDEVHHISYRWSEDGRIIYIN